MTPANRDPGHATSDGPGTLAPDPANYPTPSPSTNPGPTAPGKLIEAIRRTGTTVSVGLEPADDRLPNGVEPTITNHERFLNAIIDATAPLAPAFKLNLAFFEALGPEGWHLMHRLRHRIPQHAFLIADGKRGDIGSSAQRYAHAIFDLLNADAATVNPLMGADAIQPFLNHPDRLTYLLCLTSNPGSADLLLHNHLFLRIAELAQHLGTNAHIGLVVGATAQPEHLTQLAPIVGNRPLLIPGVGAQGGNLRPIHTAFGHPARSASLIHATRAILPSPDTAPNDPDAFAAAAADNLRAFRDAHSNNPLGGTAP